MTYPPTPNPDGTYPPPPDPPVQPYQPPPVQPHQPYPPAHDPYAASAPPPVPYATPAPYAAPPAYGPQPQPQPYDYGYPGSPYGYSAPRQTEGLAVASLVVSCASIAGLCGWGIGGVLGILGAIFGHVARKRIRASGANGAGMALAGIIIGWIVTGISAVVVVGLIIAIASDSSSSSTF